MIVTDRFAFIHMHKTGGQSISQSLLNCVESATEIGYHYPHALLPQKHAQLPLVALIRNPWDWYVSWYAFNRKSGMSNALFRIVSNGGVSDFKTTIRNLITLGGPDEQSQFYRWALISILPNTLDANEGVGLTKNDIRALAKSPDGYLTWLFNRMVGSANRESVHIGRFENLQEDFLTIMRDLGVSDTEALQRELEKTNENSSNHSHYSHYFDEDLKNLVVEMEKTIISRFGYEFEAEGQGQDVIELPGSYAENPRFEKLLGKAKNFLLLEAGVNIEIVLQNMQQLQEKAWCQSGRERKYQVHERTQSLLLIHDSDFRHTEPTYQPLYDHFEVSLKPIIDCISACYEDDGYVIRALLARLPSGAQIDVHADNLFSLLNCHRIHIPIETNPAVIFCVGGEKKNLKAGEMWEINNATVHWVRNDGDRDRVHLIIDWVPNSHSEAR